jgi:gamma-glutamyltranspeptidase/glutathione hydrolase
VRAPNHLVASADHLATSAGVEMFSRGGNAVDAAIATNAAMAVVGPHLCGMGGDLFALVHVDGEVHALNASGRAGSGADAARLRTSGHHEIPARLHPAAVTMPGCVDGWMALHERFGTIPLDVVFAPARRLAVGGFPASALLAAVVSNLDDPSREQLIELSSQVTRRGDVVRRPGVALALAGIAARGRDSFYRGAFGEGLHEIGDGQFVDEDFATSSADWVDPLVASAFGVDLHTIPPNSQGYLTLGGAMLAGQIELPANPDDDVWAHLLIECATAAGRDRPSVLHDGADGATLLEAISRRVGEIDPSHTGSGWAPGVDGDTTYLCTAGRSPDGAEMAVSLIQSNANGLGSHLVEPSTGINLHNRGIGFSLESGHPAELAPGRRPPHTLSPALATDQGALAAVFGTMGGDAQPQILLQIAARLFHHRQSPGRAVASGRWILRGAATGFDTWTSGARPTVMVEGHAAGTWADGLRARGHDVSEAPSWDSMFGHAHAIVRGRHGTWVGYADPRAVVGSCAGG